MKIFWWKSDKTGFVRSLEGKCDYCNNKADVLIRVRRSKRFRSFCRKCYISMVKEWCENGID